MNVTEPQRGAQAAARGGSVLFVDDEPRLLRAFARSLATGSGRWRPRFTSDPREVLRLLEEEPVDVLVSDIHMPEIDGLTLLREVGRRAPGTALLALTGHAEHQRRVEGLDMPHLCLTKPLSPWDLEASLELARRAHSHLVRGRRAEALPPRPRLFSALGALCANPRTPRSALVALIAEDAAIAEALVALCARTGLTPPHGAGRLESAVRAVGTSALKHLVLLLEMTALADGGPGFDADAERLRAVRVARVAAHVASTTPEPAFTAGLLSRAGRVALAVSGEAPADEEDAAPAVGAALLGAWGLDYAVIDAVARQAAPWDPTHLALDLADAVHLAAATTRTTLPPVPQLPARSLAHYRSLGVAPSTLAGWLNHAAQLGADA